MTDARALAITALRHIVSRTRFADPRHDEYQALADDLAAGRQVIEPELPKLLAEPRDMIRAIIRAGVRREPFQIGGTTYVPEPPPLGPGLLIVNGWLVEALPPELVRPGSPFTGPREDAEPLVDLKTLPGYWRMVESWVDLMVGQFSDDLEYSGAEVIGRLRAMQHAAEPHEAGVPCPVCENGAGL